VSGFVVLASITFHVGIAFLEVVEQFTKLLVGWDLHAHKVLAVDCLAI